MKIIHKLLFLLLLISTVNAREAVELFNQGKTAYFNENYDQAIYFFKKSLEINPNYFEPLIELAHVYYDLMLYDYANHYISQALKFFPEDQKLIIFLAKIETELKRYQIAEKKYKAIIEEDPLNIDAYNGLAHLYLVTDRKILAKNTLQDILKKQPGNYQALLLMAKYYEDKDFQQADKYYLLNIQNNSLNPDVYYYYSIFNFNHNQIKKAISNIKTAIEIKDKIKYQVYYGKYLLYVNQGDLALKTFQQVLNQGEHNYMNYYHLAHAYYLISDFQSAIRNLKKAINLREDDEVALSFFDLVLLNKFNVDDPNRIERSKYYAQKAAAYKKQSQYDLYLHSLKQSIRLYPKNVKSRLELAHYFKSNKYPERFIRELKVINQYTSDQDIQDRLEIEQQKAGYRLGDDWNLSQYHIEPDKYTIPLFIIRNISNFHYNFEKIYARNLQMISYDRYKYEVNVKDDREYQDFQKMQLARQVSSPFYLDLAVKEESNAIEVKLNLINASTGQLLKEYRAYQIGNDRLLLTCNSVMRKLDQSIPFRAHIIKLQGNRAVINAGRYSGVKLKDQFIILKKKKYPIENNRAEILYQPLDIKGTAHVIKVDENIAEIVFKDKDFFKDIDIDDILIYDKNKK